MSITQQYLLDSHRARQHGEPVPPAPGTGDARALRALRDYVRFRAVVAGRPAHGRLRRHLRHALSGLRRHARVGL
ncbi:hypothetical protein [Streptomyces sp. NPDC058731]|uniref:hypothetical protein n=1 Tax=Streptomyces sp. NPDC058731 TaxID=3346613 RepID=UPI0036C1A8E9